MFNVKFNDQLSKCDHQTDIPWLRLQIIYAHFRKLDYLDFNKYGDMEKGLIRILNSLKSFALVSNMWPLWHWLQWAVSDLYLFIN